MMMLRTIMFLWLACTTNGRPERTSTEENYSLTPSQALALFLLSGDKSAAFNPSTLVNPFPAAGLGSSVRSSPKVFQGIARRAPMRRVPFSRMSEEAPAEEAAAPEAPEAPPAEEAAAPATATVAKMELADVKEGSDFVGKVRAVQPYGLFVDFGAKTDGLLHVSQLPNGNTAGYNEGDEVEGIIQSVDVENKKVALGSKGPLKMQFEELTIGMEFEGTIKSTMSYGAFVDIGATVDGLLHVSELSSEGKFVEDAAELVSPGDKIKCRIRAVNYDRQQVSLTCREANQQQRQPAGRTQNAQKTELLKKYADKDAKDLIDGKVVSVLAFGAFIELEPGAQGLCHISEISDNRVEDVAALLSVGDAVQVRIKNVDLEKGQMGLTMRTYDEAREKPAVAGKKTEVDPIFGEFTYEDDGLPWDEPLTVAEYGRDNIWVEALKEAKYESIKKFARRKDKGVRMGYDKPRPFTYAASKADSY